MIQHYNAKQASASLRATLRRADVRVSRIYTKEQTNGSLFSRIELGDAPRTVVDLAMKTLKAQGYDDVAVSALGKNPTVFARSWLRGRK